MTSVVRNMIEASTRSWVYKRRLPADFGDIPLFVSPSAGLKYLLKPMARVDPPLLNCATTLVKEGDVVWDVGSNIGLFSFAAATLAGSSGQVFCFEADTWLVQLMRRSCSVQPSQSAPVTVVPVALAASVSLQMFSIAERSRASNALAQYGNSSMGGIKEIHTVPAVNLDWLLSELPAPNVIKIDVEGAELDVLDGQRAILHDVRPTLICEVSNENRGEITNLLTRAKYVLYDGEQPIEKDRKLASAPWSTVAIPEESVDLIL